MQCALVKDISRGALQLMGVRTPTEWIVQLFMISSSAEIIVHCLGEVFNPSRAEQLLVLSFRSCARLAYVSRTLHAN